MLHPSRFIETISPGDRSNVQSMRYAKVKETGAEIIRSTHAGIPEDGWEEISPGILREMLEVFNTRFRSGRTGVEPQRAARWRDLTAAALERAEFGERVFTVSWADDIAFAATKKHSSN
jgi:hypothetical protein